MGADVMNELMGMTAITRVMGLGQDLVHIPTFAQQLGEPGAGISSLFSPRELRQASERSRIKGDEEAIHLAARWAGKEAVLKAWSIALGSYPNPFSVDNVPWAHIEILDDSRSRPGVYLSTDVQAVLLESLQLQVLPCWLISLTHEVSYASAVVLMGLNQSDSKM